MKKFLFVTTLLLIMSACTSTVFKQGVATWEGENVKYLVKRIAQDNTLTPEQRAQDYQAASGLQCLLDEDAKEEASTACACSRAQTSDERMTACTTWAGKEVSR